MKRLIALAIALQIGLTPFCSVFAAKPPDFGSMDCAPMEHSIDQQHIDAPSTSHLSCCVTKPSSDTAFQTVPIFESRAPIADTSICVQNHVLESIVRTADCFHFKIPPDDFERLSQSKRE